VETQIAVVGLGVMGSATLAALAERGVRCAGFDRFAPPHPHGSSHGESRMIRAAYYEDPGYVPLLTRAYDRWRRLERDTGAPLLHITGGLMLGPPDGTILPGMHRTAAVAGTPLEPLTPAARAARFPQFHPEPGLEAIVDPQAGWLDAEGCVAAQRAWAARHGAEVHTRVTVHRWEPRPHGVRVQTDRGPVDADAVVLAAGPWMPELVSREVASLTLERQLQCWFTPPDAAYDRGAFPVFMAELADGATLYGFPRGPRGWKASVHHAGATAASAETLDRTVTPGDVRRVRDALARLFPWVATAPLREAVVCPYTNAPGHRFVIDRVPGAPRVIAVSACSGHGFKFASAVGESVAALALGEAPPVDLTPFGVSG
jgi:sarcosine oxidase